MISYDVKKSKIYDEFNSYYTYDYNSNWFDRVREKYIHNIDTFYYVVYIKNNYNECGHVKEFLNYLELKKNESIEVFDEVILDEISTDLVITPLSFQMYSYSIEKKDKYIFFFARKKATEDTPEVLVQIRSQYLWLYGEHRAIEESFIDLGLILSQYNINIERIVENRIDFSYHTNYIQDPLNFFKEENLNKMQVSRFTRWHKEGRFVGDEIVECDYISLGRRKSNNTFIRIYNKTQEVLNQQYKQFFIKIWLLNGLINRFDYFVLEKCFKEGSYNYVDRARLEFYLEYGQDVNIKNKINSILKGNDNLSIKNLADELVPKLTIVVNIEIQTKRKFYSTMDNSISLLKTVTCKYKELERIYKILDNKDIFHNYITNYVIRFVDFSTNSRKKNCDTSTWWKRLQGIKLYNVITDENRKLIREYQKDLDIDSVKKRVLNSLSTLSVYMKNENQDTLASDVVDFMSYLNESDIQKSLEYKKKKSAMLKNRLQNLESVDLQKNFIILDSETAEILD